MSGADLEFTRLQREAGTGGSVDGARLIQLEAEYGQAPAYEDLFAINDRELFYPRGAGGSNITLVSGRMNLTYISPRKNRTITRVLIQGGGTAAGATPTLFRVGIYRVNPDRSLTLIGTTANDTTAFNATNQGTRRALEAPVKIEVGIRYAVGTLMVSAAAMPTIIGMINSYPSEGANVGYSVEPRMAGSIPGLADLPVEISSASITTVGAVPLCGAVFDN